MTGVAQVAPEAAAPPFGPWHPGVVSPVPARLRHLATALTPDNALTPFADARELADLTGLAPVDVVALRPERLVLHEILVRVTADFSVPDGPRIEDLGINLREITRVLLARHVGPRMPGLVAHYEALRERIEGIVRDELAVLDERTPDRPGGRPQPTARGGPGRLVRWLRGEPPRERATAPSTDAERVAAWRVRARDGDDELARAALAALARAGGALLVRHGRLWGGRDVLARLATAIACNEAAGEALGRLVEPLLLVGAAKEGYRLLPSQQVPVVMNTKGPSAAGKSTIRPLQRSLAARIGVSWADFALISPDIWRKQLLDYSELGPDYKYGASLTGEELALIDHKLDRYMARKAARGDMPHLLIDRFRFESFAPDSDEAGSNLLTRFGERIYLFFLVASPASLVERAWQRGLEVGRYKSVDDVLAHAVEAYSGFEELLFTWVERPDKRVHFEFLDNDVPQGEPPRTAAFGWNSVLNVLDVTRLLDIERFRRIDVDATSAATLFPTRDVLAPAANAGLVARCLAHFAEVNFAAPDSGEIYLTLREGAVAWRSDALLREVMRDGDARDRLLALVPRVLDAPCQAGPARHLDAAERVHTVGRWGNDAFAP